MTTIYRIAESLIKLNNWECQRLDIQHYEMAGVEGFVGYATIKGFKHNLIIRHDGSFEWSEN